MKSLPLHELEAMKATHKGHYMKVNPWVFDTNDNALPAKQACYKQRPGSLPLYCRKPKATVTLHDQESALLLQWLDSVTQQNEGKRVERAKGKEPGVSTEQSSEASEKSVVVVGHRVTKEGMEYLVKGTQEPDSAGMWIPRENVDLTLVVAYTRRQRASRCST